MVATQVMAKDRLLASMGRYMVVGQEQGLNPCLVGEMLVGDSLRDLAGKGSPHFQRRERQRTMVVRKIPVIMKRMLISNSSFLGDQGW